MSTSATMTALEAALARLDAPVSPARYQQAMTFKPVTRAQADAARAFIASGERIETATVNASGEVIHSAPIFRFGGVSEALRMAAE